MGLRPKRNLLNHNFEGYRLSCNDSGSVKKCYLEQAPLDVPLSEKFFSFQLVRAFSSFNHLFRDSYGAATDCYFVDQGLNVVRCSVDCDEVKVTVVLTLPPRLLDHGTVNFQPSVVFSGQNTAVISNGCGCLHLIAIDRQAQASTWTLADSFQYSMPCLLLDCIEQDGRWLCAVLTVEIAHEGKDQNSYGLHCFCLEANGHGQILSRTVSQLSGSSVPLYTALCPSDSSLCVLCEGRFSSLSSHTAVAAASPGAPVDAPSVPKNPSHNWQQSSDDVTVVFDLEPDVKARDIVYSLHGGGDISLGLTDGVSLLRGQLAERVDVEGSAWTIENHKLELCLAKYQPGKQWSSLLVDSNGSTEDAFPLRSVENLSEEQKQAILQQMEHMTSDKMVTDAELGQQQDPMFHQELEECDKLPDKEHQLIRYSSDGCLLQVTNVSANQWLFNTRLTDSAMPSLCLRCDVDACVWQPDASSDTAQVSTGHFQCEHVATFNALGYVAASKQQKKLMACPPDASYSVICECTRNVFLYYPQPNGECQNTSLQSIFSLPPPSDDSSDSTASEEESILGVVALPLLRVLVLTQQNVYLLKI